jgi:hypothetical protein
VMFAFGALIAGGYLRTAVAISAMGIGLAVLGVRGSIKPLTQIMDVLSSLTGAGLGVWKSLRGESYQVWTPVASVRRGVDS